MNYRWQLIVATALVSVVSYGDVFTWVGDGRDAKGMTQYKVGLFNEVANWRMGENDNGEVASRIPGENDWVWCNVGQDDKVNSRNNFDMGGETHTIYGYSLLNNWKRHYLVVTNGTLVFKGSYSNNWDIVTIRSGGCLRVLDSATSRLGNSGTRNDITVNAGGRLEMGGVVSFYNHAITVNSGGELVFSPRNFSFDKNNTSSSASHLGQGIFNSGTAELPNGLFLRDTSKWAAPASFALEQLAGTMTLGGNIIRENDAWDNMKGWLTFRLAGGTLRITEDVGFERLSEVKSDANATAAIEVSSGKTFDTTPFVWGAGTTLNLTGAGTVLFVNMPSAVNVSAGFCRVTKEQTLSGVSASGGTLVLDEAMVFDGVTLASGAKVHFNAAGSTFSSVEGVANATYTINEDKIGPGATLVFSEDESVLNAVKDNLQLPSGWGANISAGALRIVVESANTFACEGEMSLGNAAGWKNGLPGADADVVVSGSDTIAIWDGTAPKFGQITVQDGATLRISVSDTVMPALKLSYDAKVIVAGGSKASFVAGVAADASRTEIPVFEIATNAVATFAESAVLKNLDFRLYGKIVASKSITFGWAAAGETSYFEMIVDGGTMEVTERGFARNLICPEAGGCVKVPSGKIIYRNAKTMPMSTSSYRACSIGYQNPVTEEFTVEVDGCMLDGGQQGSYVGGSATVSLINGASFGKSYLNTHPGLYSWIQFLDRSRLVMDDASTFTFYRGNGARNLLKFSPTDDGFESIVLKGGSSIAMHEYNNEGNRKAVIAVENGYWDIPQLPKTNKDFPEVTDTRVWTIDPLHRFKEVNIRPEGKFYLRGASTLWGDEWNRSMKLSNVPFTGSGDVIMTNAVSGYTLDLVLTATNNTTTGEIAAYPAADGTRATLHFNDGTAWAGTVVAGNIAMTNTYNASRPATVKFAALRLDGPMMIRVWKNGQSVASDKVELDTAPIKGRGGFAPVPMEGYTPQYGDSFDIGTCPDSFEIPEEDEWAYAVRGWKLRVIPSAEPGKATMRITRETRGLIVILH